MAYRAFDAGPHLPGVVGLLASLGWDNFHYDPGFTRRSLTAPGVTTIVALALETGEEVVGFAQVFSDGVFQAHLGLLAVDEGWRRRGVGRGLVEEAFARVGAERMDLIASDGSLAFYRSFRHREQVGFRIYAEDREERG
ncbi:MAG: GNAT family N-acetyltransferase [Actinomycetota bacterium]|nr:GNAT family N-acetyltransferase [Actinomycetota bacterium]